MIKIINILVDTLLKILI